MDTEAHIHASLDSEHITPLLLSAEDEASLHLVVRWADGGDLRQHLAAAPLGEHRLREFVVRPLLHALALLDAKVRAPPLGLSRSSGRTSRRSGPRAQAAAPAARAASRWPH